MSKTPDRAEIKSRLRVLIESELKIKIAGDDQDLLGTDTIDSYTMMLVIAFIKKEFGVGLDVEKMDFDAFASLNTMADMALNPPG